LLRRIGAAHPPRLGGGKRNQAECRKTEQGDANLLIQTLMHSGTLYESAAQGSRRVIATGAPMGFYCDAATKILRLPLETVKSIAMISSHEQRVLTNPLF
jgi:hypothetical protein